jgi:TolB-like protein
VAEQGSPAPPESDRLDSWKEIAAYLGKYERTVRRWEVAEGLPVHRHRHSGGATVYASKSEIEVWLANRSQTAQMAAPRRIPISAAIWGIIALVAFASAAAWFFYLGPARYSASRPTLAVLPFVNLSGNPADEFFSDGLTEEIISQVSEIGSGRIWVIARTSSMSYKGKTKRIDEIGRELGANFLLEGSVRKEGERLRISAQLIKVKDQTHIWSQNYDRSAREIFAVQEEVCREIAARIRGALPGSTLASHAGPHAPDPQAYELYLKGLHLMNTPSRESITKAIEFFQRAADKDPEYASAHAALAFSRFAMAWWGYATFKETMPLTLVAARRALTLDPDNARALMIVAESQLAFDRKWDAALPLTRRSVELQPSDAFLRVIHADALLMANHHDEAVRQLEMVQKLDPLSLWAQTYSAMLLGMMRRTDEAIAASRKVLEYDPDNLHARWVLAVNLTHKGRYDEAIAEFLRRKVPTASTNWALGYTYGLAGHRDEARRILDFLLDLSHRQYIVPEFVAIQYIGLGDNGKALDILEKAVAEFEAGYMYRARTDPMFDRLRNEPRFQALLARLNLPK